MKALKVDVASATGPVVPAAKLASGGIPDGFELKADGIHMTVDGANVATELLCSPLVIKARMRDVENTGWGRVIALTDHEGKQHTIAVLDSALQNDPKNVRAKLIDHGLRLQSGRKAQDALSRLIQDWEPTVTLTSTKRLGWSDNTCSAFVTGDHRRLGKGQFFYTGSPGGADTVPFTPHGTLDEWKASVASLCKGNPMLIVAVSLAFAGPLLELAEEEGGGLHLQGSSSCGKTTIQKVATSVWRNPSAVGSWRTTTNGLEETARLSNSMLLPLDELAEISATDLEFAIYMLINSVGKTRASRDGGAAPPANWRVAILSTGELSIAEKLVEGGRRAMAGLGVRMLDIEVDTGTFGAFDDLHGQADGAAFSKSLKHSATTSYGTAGPAFVDFLLRMAPSGKTTIQNTVDKMTQRLRQKYHLGDQGQMLRAARRLAVIACAGEIATKAGITGWTPGEALRAAESAFELWLEGLRGDFLGEIDPAKERTVAFLTKHAADFVDLKTTTSAAAATPVGWQDASHFYISNSSWRLAHGDKGPISAKALASTGLLAPGDGKNMMSKAPRSIKGRPRLYKVSKTILSTGEGSGP